MIQRRAGRLPGRPLLRQLIILQMTYPKLKDFAAIALSALTGAGIAVSFLASENGSNALSIVVFAVTMILCPTVAGYLSTRSRNVVPYPAAVLVGLEIWPESLVRGDERDTTLPQGAGRWRLMRTRDTSGESEKKSEPHGRITVSGPRPGSGTHADLVVKVSGAPCALRQNSIL